MSTLESLHRDEPALVVSEISKHFGRAAALDNVSLTVRKGTVHALLGENGAGKTTLMRIAFGLLAPDSGTVTVAGAERRIASAANAIDAGLGMVHQHFTNVPQMTVAENVALGQRGRFSAEEASRRVMEIAGSSGLHLDGSALAAELPVGAQQRLEIVKALSRQARTLILDEPTAVLAPLEANDLLRWVRRFADEGNSVVLITHKLQEALSVADDVTVLRRGRVVLQRMAADVTADTLARALFGEDLSPATGRQSSANVGPIVASASRVEILNERGSVAVRDANLEIRSGEVLGIAAIEGAGQRELLRALAGRAAITRGELHLPSSIGFVPEDRQRDSLILEFSLAENVALNDAGARRGMLRMNVVRERTAALIREFDVRGGDERSPARSLSGGNQQKLVLARELAGSPELLVVENPTRGLDIRASRSVHDRLNAAAAGEAAVVMYSSDLDEILAFATRIVVMHGGDLRESTRDRDAVGRAMLGVI